MRDEDNIPEDVSYFAPVKYVIELAAQPMDQLSDRIDLGAASNRNPTGMENSGNDMTARVWK